jgi:hypothetical protein
MIAYNRTYLTNLAIIKKAKYWYAKKLLSREQFTSIENKYIINFYSPALFIRIGLFIFTCILVSAAISLFTAFFFLFTNNASTGFGIFICLLFTTGCFIALEILIKKKNIYCSGIDDALLYSGLGFLFGALCFIFEDHFNNSNTILFYSILFLPILVCAVIRYSDKLISLLLGICAYTVFFLMFLKLGEIAKMIMPFALMILSVSIYFVSKKYRTKQNLFFWKSCMVVFECVTLLVFYLACNYYVIRESSISFFDMHLAQGEDIPLAFLFYILTALVPVLYVFYGLKRKDKVLLWIGLVLIAAAALTFKYYFSLGHPEITLTVAGIIMIAISYLSIKYLKTPRYRITFEEEKDEDNFLKTNAEALVIAQSFSQQGQSNQQQNTTEFGGGDFGGAGAGSKF